MKNKKIFTIENLSEGPIIQGFYYFRKLTFEQKERLKKMVKDLNIMLERQ